MSEVQEKKQAPESTKERIPVYLYPNTIRQIEKTMEMANCKSRSEFLENAAVFYAGYIAAQNSESFLSPALTSTLRATLNDSEGRTARLLFKLAASTPTASSCKNWRGKKRPWASRFPISSCMIDRHGTLR